MTTQRIKRTYGNREVCFVQIDIVPLEPCDTPQTLFPVREEKTVRWSHSFARVVQGTKARVTDGEERQPVQKKGGRLGRGVVSGGQKKVAWFECSLGLHGENWLKREEENS